METSNLENLSDPELACLKFKYAVIHNELSLILNKLNKEEARKSISHIIIEESKAKAAACLLEILELRAKRNSL